MAQTNRTLDFETLVKEHGRVHNVLNSLYYREPNDPKYSEYLECLKKVQSEWIKSTELENLITGFHFSNKEPLIEQCKKCGKKDYLYKSHNTTVEDKKAIDLILNKYNIKNPLERHPGLFIFTQELLDPNFIVLNNIISKYSKVCEKCIVGWLNDGLVKMDVGKYKRIYVRTQYTIELEKARKSSDEVTYRYLIEHNNIEDLKKIPTGVKVEDPEKEYIECEECSSYFEKDINGLAYGCDSTIEKGTFYSGYGSIYDNVSLKVILGYVIEKAEVCDHCVHKNLMDGKFIYNMDNI